MRIGKIIWLIIGLGVLGCQVNPNDLETERNLLRGIELSERLKKPVFIHFTGYGCVGYNEFYNDLITSREVFNKLNNEFITVELFVDDKRKIQINDTLNIYKMGFSEEGKGRMEKAQTVGDINTIIEIDWLKFNTQPLYVIADSKREILVGPFGYIQGDEKYFLTKLNEGLRAFKKKATNH